MTTQVVTAQAVAGAPTCGTARPCSRACTDRRAAQQAVQQAVEGLTGASLPRLTLIHRAGAAAHVIDPAVAVSVAHARGRAVAAAAPRGRRIGVDLERCGTVLGSEMRLFATGDEAAAGIDATILWTLKEAAWKALGLQRSVPFRALSLAFENAELRGLTCNGVHIGASARVWTPWHGWTAALVEVAAATQEVA